MRPLLAMAFVLATVDPLSTIYALARRYDQASFRYVPPSPERVEGMRRLFSSLAREVAPGPPPEPLRARARALGLELVQGRDAAGELWILREPADRREGAGLYVLRPGGAPLCLQAPHTFFDEGTGDLALELFASLRAACLFTNTVHRYAPSASGEKGRADVAHAEGTLFLAATEGLLEATRWPLVQLHGFGPKEAIPADVAAVVSDGTGSPQAQGTAGRLRATLRRTPGFGRVLLYGEDARVLGATTNLEGARARRAGIAFLHVELSAETRQRLRASGAGPLAAAIEEALSLP